MTCAAGCRRIRGFPQFLQNWLESGFWVPHSPQNIRSLRKGLMPPEIQRAVPGLCGRERLKHGKALHGVPPPPVSFARQVSRLISPMNIRLIFEVPISWHAPGLLFTVATSHRQSISR